MKLEQPDSIMFSAFLLLSVSLEQAYVYATVDKIHLSLAWYSWGTHYRFAWNQVLSSKNIYSDAFVWWGGISTDNVDDSCVLITCAHLIFFNIKSDEYSQFYIVDC